MKKGLFVSFEGIDGSGKTTQIRLLCQVLKAEGYKVVAVREPGGTFLSEKIREILLDTGNDAISPRAEPFLYAAARIQLVVEVIDPALAEGRIVIADRYHDSTLAYQGYGRGLNLSLLDQLNQLATGGTIPDLTILLDIAPEEGLARRGNLPPDRLEREGLEFQQAVREGYLALSRRYPERIKVVEAHRPVGQVHEHVLAMIKPYLKGVCHSSI